MDFVYDNFVKTFRRENLAIECRIQNFSDFFSDSCEELLKFKENKISVTKLKNEKYFISNCDTKGFLLEKRTEIDTIPIISDNYKKLQKSIGKITDLFGFSNRYFDNIVELFSYDKGSVGLGDFTAELLGKTNNKSIIGKINIDNLFTIAYEANGNRIVLDKDNHIYIYAHDLITHHYQKIEGIPVNTFYKIPNIEFLENFAEEFFSDFFKK